MDFVERETWKQTVAQAQSEIHNLQMRVKALSEENYELRKKLTIPRKNE
jgi:hypothetical protein